MKKLFLFVVSCMAINTAEARDILKLGTYAYSVEKIDLEHCPADYPNF